MRKARIFTLTATLAGLLALSSVAAAQQGPPQRKPRCNNLRAIARVVQLSPTQVDQTRVIFDELRQTVEPLRQQIPPLREALEDLLDADSPVACDVGQAVVDIDVIRDQIEDARGAAQAEFEGLLTAEQLARYETFQENCREGYQHGE